MKRNWFLIFIVGSWGCEHYARKELTAWVRRQYSLGARICSVELGCYIVARAGLLAGKKLTTHWSWLPGFRERFSETEVCEQLFTRDEKILSCAGGVSGIDMMLSLIGEKHGSRMSGEIADQMLFNPIRVENSPQRRILGRTDEELMPLVDAAEAKVRVSYGAVATPRILSEFEAARARLVARLPRP